MIYAFVPARSGSTRLPHKNIKKLAGLPLIGWSLHAAMESKLVDKVIFSSDSTQYIDIAKSLCKWVDKELLIDRRSETHSQNKSKIFDYLKSELLEKFDFQDEDMLVQLLPTCPLRRPEHIDAAIELAMTNTCGVFTACEYDFHVSFAFSGSEKGQWEPLLADSPMVTGNTQSQNQKVYLHPNGSINCLPISLLREGCSSIYEGCRYYKMDKIYSVDIDDLYDFKRAEAILTSK